MVQTNNSFLADKVALRAGHLPSGDHLRVLDCYGGEGKIWAAVKRLTGRRIDVLSIDIKEYESVGFHLPGDNRSYLSSLNLKNFDVIDLDAYGVPFDQLELVFKSKFSGVVFITFIQSVVGVIPYDLLVDVGFSREMIRECKTLFFKSGWKYFLEYLGNRGVKSIWHRSHARKHYLGFSCAEVRGEGYNIPLADRIVDHA